jgi:hypothetical protein
MLLNNYGNMKKFKFLYFLPLKSSKTLKSIFLFDPCKNGNMHKKMTSLLFRKVSVLQTGITVVFSLKKNQEEYSPVN